MTRHERILATLDAIAARRRDDSDIQLLGQIVHRAFVSMVHVTWDARCLASVVESLAWIERCVEEGQAMKQDCVVSLYGVMVKAKGLDFWTLDQRWFEDLSRAREWAEAAWEGTGCETRIVELGAQTDLPIRGGGWALG